MFSSKQLNNEQIESIYNKWMVNDFPINELKPLAMIKKALKKHEYECFGLFENDTVCGYAFYVKQKIHSSNILLLDYFAIDPNKRNNGLGSLFLKLLSSNIQSADMILCEAENPDYPSNFENQEIMKKRIDFYLKNGFRLTGVTARVFGVEYVILETGGNHSEDVIGDSYKNLYKSFLPALLYLTNIKIH